VGCCVHPGEKQGLGTKASAFGNHDDRSLCRLVGLGFADRETQAFRNNVDIVYESDFGASARSSHADGQESAIAQRPKIFTFRS